MAISLDVKSSAVAGKAASISYKDLLIAYLAPQWPKVLLMTVLLLVSISLQVVNPQILRYFIDTALAGGDATGLMLAGLLFVGIALVKQIAAIADTYVSENVAWSATNRLRVDLVVHCLGLDMAFHKEHTAGELIERIDTDVDTLSNFFSRSFIYLFGNGLLILGIVMMLFLVDWRVGLVMGGFAMVALVTLIVLRNFAVPMWEANSQKEAEFLGFLGERLSGTEDLRANGATGYVMWRFYKILRSWYPVSKKASITGATMWMMSMLLFGVGSAIALALGAYLWSLHSITIGTVYLIFAYTVAMQDPMYQIRTELEGLQKAGAGVVRVRKLLGNRSAIIDGIGTPLPDGALPVEFRDVTFSYNEGDPVLEDITLRLEPGKILGVLGRTGSGKTTLARLLLRLYDVQEGEVRIGDVAVRETRVRELRQRIGMVTQDVQLFHASVRDNLTFFNQAILDERILEVLEDIGMMPWFRSLPQGLDTVLGAEGEGLSAGESQLLAFARVFLTNPGLVILDEASSRLDPATEQLIERAMSKLLQGRTGIVIAHRLGTVQRADEILIIDDGRIVEHGGRLALASNAESRFAHLLARGLEEVLA